MICALSVPENTGFHVI